jgi:hypothetical protein
MRRLKALTSEWNKVNNFYIIILDFPGFGGDDELNDEDDMPEMPEEHVHGENCNHDNEPKANLDDLDVEASK